MSIVFLHFDESHNKPPVDLSNITMEGMGDFFPKQGERLFNVCDSLESRERESRFPKKDREVADMAKPATPEEEISRENTPEGSETEETPENQWQAQAREEYLSELRRREQEETDRRFGQQARSWLEESREVEKRYPGFSLEHECQDPRFLRLLEVGMDMCSAFEALHHREILENAVRYAVMGAAEKLAENLRSRRNRPAENGTSGRSGAVIRPDVRRLTRKDREEMERRALHGERITF